MRPHAQHVLQLHAGTSLCSPGWRCFVLTGLLNFNRVSIELYVELDPHPGGWDYLLLAGIRMV